MKNAKTLVELSYVNNDQVSEISYKNNNLLIVGTTESPGSNWLGGILGGQSDGFIASYLNTGLQNWSVRLGSDTNEIATAHARDQDGSIWILGASNTTTIGTQTIIPPTIINPDNVPITPSSTILSAMTKIKVWQISSAGALIKNFEYVAPEVVLPNKIFVTNSSLTIFGNIYGKTSTNGFYISASKDGVFGNLLKIGATATQLNSAILQSNGNFIVVGSSSDKILKSKPIGKVDAITLNISSSGEIQQVARATLKNTSRSWSSIDVGLLQGGRVNYSSKAEAAITKFSALNKPVWNVRYVGKSAALVASGKNSWATFISSGQISGVPKWKPKTSSSVLLEFGKKGELINSYLLPAPAVAIDADTESGTFLVTDSGKSLGLVLIN
jgi:hypothetical protein